MAAPSSYCLIDDVEMDHLLHEKDFNNTRHVMASAVVNSFQKCQNFPSYNKAVVVLGFGVISKFDKP